MPTRLLIEGARTNGIRNPRGEGAVVGNVQGGSTAGSLPTYWSIAGSSPVVDVVGSGSEGGRPYVDVRVRNAVAGAAFAIAFGSTSEVAVSVGQTWTGAFYARLVGGSMSGLSATANVTTTGNAEQFSAAASVTASWQRFPVTATISASGSTTAVARLRLSPSTAYDATFRLSMPSMEQAPFASTPILPPPGTLAASSRANETLNTAWSYPRGTVLFRGSIPQAAPSGLNQILFQIDNGADSDRIVCYNPGGTTAILAEFYSAGVSVASLNLGSFAVGSTFSVGVAYSYSGLSGVLNAGTLRTALATKPSGLTTLRVANNVTGSSALFGWIEAVVTYPSRLSDSDLIARVAAL